jgi:hypothetical protein
MKMKNIIIGLLFITAFGACNKEYEPEMIDGNELAGDWFVKTYTGGAAVIGYQHIVTATTAAADGKELLISDGGHIWDFKVKCPMDFKNKTFSSKDSLNNLIEGYDIKILVKEGKVIKDGGRSKTGVKTDSIYMVVEFSDDLGTDYEISGHMRTGFVEDEY